MSNAELVTFLVQIAVMLGVAVVCGQIAARLRLPAVLGELVGGVVLGPTVFGTFAPALHGWVFPAGGTILAAREAVLKLGLLFFMFVAGLEIDLSNIRRQGPLIIWTSISGMIVPFALGFGCVVLLPDIWGTQAHGNPALFALFLGTALSISALPVIARILIDLNLIKSPVGVVVMAAAIIDDIIGWTLFAAILRSLAPGNAPMESLWATLALVAGLFACILTIGRWAGLHLTSWSKRYLPRPNGLIALSAVAVLLAAAAAEAIGIHAALGAFLAGMALAPGGQADALQEQAYRVVSQFVFSFFAPIYFVSIGLKVNFIAHFDLLLVLIVLLVACVGKIGGASFGARVGGLAANQALAVGFGMNARGAIEIILATIALDQGLIDRRIFVALVVMALATSLISGPAMQHLLTGHARSLTVAVEALPTVLQEDRVL